MIQERYRRKKSLKHLFTDKLTRRECTSKIAEIYDLTGKITPLVAAMKLDFHHLVKLKLDWDDIVPDNLRPIWLSNFKTIQQMKDLTYRRAIVPIDAVNTDIQTIDFGDASGVMACSAIYARFLRRNGKYSCQLVLGRSKLIAEGTTSC